jgi:iron-sulfur cluster repair protein YtfE (RIC family)
MIVEMGDYAWSEAVQTIPWPAMSPDMNPREHLWDFIGRKINQRNPKCQNIDELRTAILQEWQQFPQERLRRLVRSMTRRVTELHNKRGGSLCGLALSSMNIGLSANA